MKKKPDTTKKEPIFSYWHAVETFGERATDKVITDFGWMSKYPNVVAKIKSGDIRARNLTVIPDEIIYEIAGRPECLFDFYADCTNDDILYAAIKNEPLRAPFELPPVDKLQGQVALMKYGAYCLFKAASQGVGHRSE